MSIWTDPVRVVVKTTITRYRTWRNPATANRRSSGTATLTATQAASDGQGGVHGPARVPPQADSSYYVGFEAECQHIGLVPGGGPQGMTSPVAYWHVPDIEAKLAEVTAAGATVKEPVHEVGPGRVVATVTDPDGNVLGLLQDR